MQSRISMSTEKRLQKKRLLDDIMSNLQSQGEEVPILVEENYQQKIKRVKVTVEYDDATQAPQTLVLVKMKR